MVVKILLVSLFLLMGVVNSNSNGNSGGKNVSISTKAVTIICTTTDFKDACLNSLNGIAKNGSATLKDYIVAAIQATIEEAEKSFKVAETFKLADPAKADPRQEMAMEDCREQLRSAIEELQAAISMVGESDMQTIYDHTIQLLNWFTAVVSYQVTCLDQLELPEYKTPIQNGLLNATQLTSNAINIFARIRDILHALNIQVDIVNDRKNNNSNNESPMAHSQRRLLQVAEVGQDRYPIWFSHADRKLLAFPNQGGGQGQGVLTPNAVVAKDGSGQYTTISAAVAAIPQQRQGVRWIIYVKAGIYNENVIIPGHQSEVFMYGDGPTRTIVTGSRSAAPGTSTKETATFAAIGKRFIAKGIGFRNTAGREKQQAVAFRCESESSAFFNCSFEGYQDTLYYHRNRQFYRNCVISGTIDFIFGTGTALIQDSDIIVRMPLPNQQNMVTADGNSIPRAVAGLVLQNCMILPEPELLKNKLHVKSYLGRPWKTFATTAIIESEIGDFIHPEGWHVWNDTSKNHETATYVEYGNRGPGANTDQRVRWGGVSLITNKNEALRYTIPGHLEGDSVLPPWVVDTVTPVGIPVTLGLTY